MMKPFVRSMLALMLIGAVLAGAGYAMGGKTSIYYGKGMRPVVNREGPSELLITEPLEFTALDVNVSVADVEIVRGDAFLVEARYQSDIVPGYALEDGVLKVYDSGSEGVSVMNFGIGTVRSNKVIITLPAGHGAARASITSDVGSVNVRGLSFDTLDVRSDVGSVDLRDTECRELRASSDVGSVRFTNLTTAELFTSTSGAGSIKGTGTLGGKLDLRSDVGSIDISTTLPRDSYLVDATADVGRVKLSPDAPDPVAADNTMTLRSGVGNVNCEFGG